MSSALGVNEATMVKLMTGQTPLVDPFVLRRFYLSLMLNDLRKGESFWQVSEFYGCDRGDVQNLLSRAASFVSCIHYFVQELGEFRDLSDSLHSFVRELAMSVNSELIPLMELPSMSKNKARLLYDAGFRSLADVAKSSPGDLAARVQHVSKQAAQHMVSAAKALVYERVDALRDEADALMELVPKTAITSSLLDESVLSVLSDNSP